MDNLVDRALEALDKAVIVYERAEDAVVDNWKSAAIGAGIGVAAAALLALWVSK